MTSMARALAQFDADAFVRRHGGYKESLSPLSFEYLLNCTYEDCLSSRLRWNAAKGTWICWGCKRTGDTVRLVQLMEQCGELDAIDYIMRSYVGGDAQMQLAPLPEKQRRETLRVLPPIPWPSGVEMLCDAPAHSRGWAYLRGRGISAEDIAAHRIGFGRVGRLANYVVFPCFVDNALVYWQGRASWDPPPNLDDAALREWKRATGYRKTLNPTAYEGHATAGEVLYGYDRARTCEDIVVVEGPIDAVQAGPGAVALLGKAATGPKIARLLRLPARSYTVYLDRDADPEPLAAELSPFGDTYIAVPPPRQDPGSLSREQNRLVLQGAERFSQKKLVGIGES